MLQHPPTLPGSHLIHPLACQAMVNGYFQALASPSRTQLCWTALLLMLSLSKSQLILLGCTWQKRALSRVFFHQGLKLETEKGKKPKPQVFRTPIPSGRKWDEWSHFHQSILKYTALPMALHWKCRFTPHTIYWSQKELRVVWIWLGYFKEWARPAITAYMTFSKLGVPPSPIYIIGS